MRHRWYLTLLFLSVATPLSAQDDATAPDPASPLRDALVAPRPLPVLRLGLKPLDLPFPIELPALPTFDRSPILWGDRTAAWAARVRADLARRPWRSRLGYRDPVAAADHSAAARLVPDVFEDFIDLGMRVSGRAELGGAWTRFVPCDPTLQLNCNPGMFPLLKPEMQFGILVAGTISDRIHVDVDYDQRREFDAANNINVYYQGLEGEVLQRLEVGDVSIRLPSSRYLTEGVPGGNFGFKATGQIGRMDVQAIWAQQKGDVSTREFRLGGGIGAGGLVQDARVVLDDADYVKGQFFFLVDPESLAGYPHVDILSIVAHDAPATVRPARGLEIQLYRDERPSFVNPEQQAQLGYFLAEAVAADGLLRHRGQFRRLVPGADYYVHPSGLWLMLRSPLRADEALAVSYATDAGGVVGTLDAERVPPGAPPTLLLLRGPATIHQPGQATWRFEMHQIYRLDSSAGVEPETVTLEVSLGELAAGGTFKRVGGRTISYLKLFGMDEHAPEERLDEARIFQPSRGGPGMGFGDPSFGGSFVVFPTLRPFAEPPPVPSAGLSAPDAAAVLGVDANREIYDGPDPVLRDGASRFRLNFEYRVRMDGPVSSFNLGAFGIREGSEVIILGGRTLRRDVDYTIDYDLGQVTLSNAQALLGADPAAEIRATWEQRALFQVAPRSLFGLNVHYPFGTAGELNLVGLYQAEKPITMRPQLGLEPGAIFLGGASGSFEFGAGWLDRALGWLPDRTAPEESRVRVSGELAVSMPNPNRRGDTYLDDFEGGDEFRIGLERHLWRLGSRPDDPAGADAALPLPLDVATATTLVWQHDLLDPGGRVVGPLLAREIDAQINVAGAQRTEPVFYLTLGDPATPAGSRRWRSITTVLETTGRDMSRSEYLEFYAAADPGQEIVLVFDIGTVSEDAFAYDDLGRTSGEYPDGRRWGLGILDEEARVADREIWSTARDTLGLWNQNCRAEPGRQSYSPGDPRANCTRGNGIVDTEDLDGNGILDAADGAYFRYVVRLDASSPYLVRGRGETGTEFGLYRIPLRGPGALGLNGANEATWRYIKHLRLTVAGRVVRRTTPDVALARVRVVGSRWTKRDLHGILAGIAGDEPGRSAATARFQVGPVSRITDGAAYTSPPGVSDQLQDPSSAFGSTGVEYNEKSLRLTYSGLEPGDRAEAYYRFPQQPRNLLSYRELRLWAVTRGGRWNDPAGERLLVSVGTDPKNRYLFQARLRSPVTGRGVVQDDWLPEIIIDFAEWFELKARAEEALIAGGHAPGEPVTVWSADSSYAVVLEDRARAPNLAAVRELAFAVYNAGGAPAEGEVWIDDLRLGGAVREMGMAGHWEVDVRAGDLASVHLSIANRGGDFRQMSHGPTYQDTRDLGVGGTVQLGRLAPEEWALDMPVTVYHSRTGLEPGFLEGSDVRADRLSGLRETGAERTRVGISVRRTAPVENPWVGWLLGGTFLRFGYHTSAVQTITTRDEARGLDGGIGYAVRPEAREIGVIPGPVEDLLRGLLPAALEEASWFRRLTTARLRWSPEDLSVSSTYTREEGRSYRYASILTGVADQGVAPVESPREGLETSTRISFRPFNSLTAGLMLTSHRDLLPSARATAQPLGQRAIDAARDRPAGLDLGWETRRTMSSQLDFRPLVTPWLRPGLNYTAYFRSDRNPSYWERVVEGDDTTAILQSHFQTDRQLTRSVRLDPEGLARSIRGEESGIGRWARGGAARVVQWLRPIDLSWATSTGSRFDRETLLPGLGYQLGLGGLDDFRLVGADTAATAAERTTFRARGGVKLPLGAALEVAYTGSDAVSLEQGSGQRSLDETTWPDLRLAWTSLPIPDAIRGIVAHGSASIGYRQALRTDRYGATGNLARKGKETGVPIQFTIGIGSGMNGTYIGQITRGEATDPTGSTEQEGELHEVQLGGSFMAPGKLRDQFPAPVRAALRISTQAQQQCRLQPGSTDVPGTSECVPFVDLVHRQLSLTLDTFVSQLNIGFQMSYSDRKSYVGIRSGSSQFQLGLFGEFSFEAGNLAGGAR